MNDSECDNNASVSPAPPATERLLSFSFYSFFRFSESFIKTDSDLKSRSFDFRRLIISDIDYTTFRCHSTDYHSQRNKEIRISGSKDPMRPSDFNNNMKNL
jgi:hypothetical protein